MSLTVLVVAVKTRVDWKQGRLPRACRHIQARDIGERVKNGHYRYQPPPPLPAEKTRLEDIREFHESARPARGESMLRTRCYLLYRKG